MIDLNLPFQAKFDWQPDGEGSHRLRANGYIRAYRHEMLTTTTCLENNALHYLVKEKIRHPPRADQAPLSSEQLSEDVTHWPLDSILVSAHRGTNGLTVEFLSGTVRTSPLYIAWTPERVRASWDITTLCTQENIANLDIPVLCAEIAMENSYTPRTLLQNVIRLQERMHVRVDANGISMREPDPAPIFTPRTLAANADPGNAYARLLQAALARPAWSPGRTAFELSGGLDSTSLVAISSTGSMPACFTSGTLLPGAIGKQQRNRRGEVRRLLEDSEDVTIEGEALCSLNLNQAFSQIPFENPNSPVGSILLKKLRSRGITTIVTGIGGDELFSRHPWEQDPSSIAQPKSIPYLNHSPGRDGCFISAENTSPFPVIAASSLLAACNRAPMFMREGVWLVNPLCSPELTRFAQQLPLEWRADRRLLRELLAKLGLTSFSKPYPSETYDQLNILNIKEHQQDIRLLFQQSRLAKLNIINRDELESCFEKWILGEQRLAYDYFHALISLELFLQKGTSNGVRDQS